MNEVPPLDRGKTDEIPSNVVDPEEDADVYAPPTEESDYEVIRSFLSQLSHPGAYQESDELARYIQKLLGKDMQKEISERKKAWQARMVDIMADSADLMPGELAKFLETDEVLQKLLNIVDTIPRRDQEIQDEFSALTVLFKLRIGTIRRNVDTTNLDPRWLNLIERLAKPYEHN